MMKNNNNKKRVVFNNNYYYYPGPGPDQSNKPPQPGSAQLSSTRVDSARLGSGWSGCKQSSRFYYYYLQDIKHLLAQ